MNLKRLVPAVAATLLACAACTDSPDGPADMAFGADFGTAESRASTSPLVGDDYRLWASAIYVFPGSTAEYYFTPVVKQLTWHPERNLYAADGNYYPLSGTMSFMAYGTDSKTVTPTVTATPATTASSPSAARFTQLKFDLRSADGTYEVVWADPVNDFACSSHPGEPLMHFHHNMVNLRFRFTAADSATTDHVLVNSVKLESASTTGIYTVDLTTGAGTWSNKGAEAPYYIASLANKHIPYPDGLDSGRGIYIHERSSRSRIIVNYTMLNDTTKIGSNAYPNDPAGSHTGPAGADCNYRTMNYVVLDDPSQGWSYGYQYNYNIKVYGNARMEFINVDVKPIATGHVGSMEI